MKKIEKNALILIEGGLTNRECMLLGFISGFAAICEIWPVAGAGAITAIAGGCFR